jgi:gamma-glutamylaminecyclotransferase
MAQSFLFVFGTLKRGEKNHHLMTGAWFLWPATTAANYRLYELGEYPGLVRDEENGLAISGELYQVSECLLEELDDFEGVPDLFVRQPIAIPDFPNPVDAYFWAQTVPAGCRSGGSWPIFDL